MALPPNPQAWAQASLEYAQAKGIDPTTIDPSNPETQSAVIHFQATKTAAAIKNVEGAHGSPTKRSPDEGFGLYQYEPKTWAKASLEYATKHHIDPTKLDPNDPNVQNAVAYNQISGWLGKGYTPKQVASLWNSGHPDPHTAGSGTNKFGVKYDAPAYVKKFESAYQKSSGESDIPQIPQQPGQPVPIGQRQEQPLTTGQKIARAAIPYTKTIFPFAGSVAGGVLAAPANAIAPGVAEAAGVGLGGAAGIQAQRALEDYAGVERPQTQGEKMLGPTAGPILDAAADVAVTGVGGAIEPTLPGIEAVGEAIPGAIEGVEGAAGRRALSSDTGVPLTPAQIGQKKSSAYLEGQLRHNMWSSDTAQQFDQEQYAALQKYGRTVQDEIFGGKSDPLTAGEEAKTGAWKRYRAFQKDASRIYDSVPVKPDTPIETQNLASTAVEHIDQLGKMESPTIKRILGIAGKGEIPSSVETSGIVDHLGRPIQTETPAKPAYTWQELRADMSKLGKMVEETSDYNKKRIYRDLLDAANKDIGAFADKVENPDVQKSLDLANKYYQYGERVFGPARDADHPGVRVWRENQIKNMMRTESPEDIGKTFFKANPNQSDIRRLKAAAGPEAFQEMKRAWLEDMLTSGENGSFSYNRFTTAYDKYKRSGNLNVMLTKEEREGLDKIYDISKSVQWSERIGGNPSGSGKMVINNMRKFVTHPVYATLEAIGAKRLAEKYFGDPEFQARLVKGLELPAGSQRARVAAATLARMAGVELRTNLR